LRIASRGQGNGGGSYDARIPSGKPHRYDEKIMTGFLKEAPRCSLLESRDPGAD
jgi:hypothetical protein